MKTLLIKNADYIVTLDKNNTVLVNSDIFIEGSAIKEIGKSLNYQADTTIDATGKVIYPGLINTHHHLYQTLTRNILQVQSAKLFDWLTYLYDIWKNLTPEAVYVSALVGLGELLLTGCTTSTDMFYVFPRKAPPDLFDYVIKAAAELGIRFIPCRGSMSRGRSEGGLPPDEVVQTPDEILTDSERIIKKFHSSDKFSMCQITLGPCSPFSVTQQLLVETRDLARKYKVKIHTHLAETQDEEDYCLKIYKKRPFDLLESLDWLGPDVWLAHCVYLNSSEIKRMAKTETGVAHCPVSNMRLGSGVAKVPEMLAEGVRVGLAVDGSASNDTSCMLAELRTALLLHRLSGADKMTPIDVWRMGTGLGAKIFGREELGSLAAGKAADMFLMNLNQLGLTGAQHDVLGMPVLAGDTYLVDTTIVNGEIVVRNGKLVKVNEEEIIKRGNQLSREMVKQIV